MIVPNDICTGLCESLTCVEHAACPDIDSFETYMRLFYQTDQHWNHVSAQQGYEDMVRLLLDEEEAPYQPVEEVVSDVLYNGSYSLRTGIHDATQYFSVYRYELPEITLKVNGKKKTVDRQKQYFSGEYAKGEIATHFAAFYGGN